MDKTYSVVEVAELLNISQSAVRKYEEDYKLRIPRNEQGRRNYSESDVELLRKIVEMKKEGHNIYTIRRALNQDPEALAVQDKNMATAPVNTLTGAELVQMLNTAIKEGVQEAVRELQEKHEKDIQEIREEIQKEFEKQHEQHAAENQKLMEFIQKSRESKENQGFFKRLFG